LWTATVLIPLVIGLSFLALLGIFQILDVCGAEKACDVVGTIALWGAVGMLGFIAVSRMAILVFGVVKALISATHRSGPTNAHTT
jgi:type III secretory pathway component EscU